MFAISICNCDPTHKLWKISKLENFQVVMDGLWVADPPLQAGLVLSQLKDCGDLLSGVKLKNGFVYPLRLWCIMV